MCSKETCPIWVSPQEWLRRRIEEGRAGAEGGKRHHQDERAEGLQGETSRHCFICGDGAFLGFQSQKNLTCSINTKASVSKGVFYPTKQTCWARLENHQKSTDPSSETNLNQHLVDLQDI